MVCGDTVHGLDRRTQAKMQARIRHKAGSSGMGAEVAFLIPISEQLVLPCNHIFCGDLVDFPLAEIREQFCFDDILLGLPCAFFQPRIEIVGVDFAERLKAHIQITGALLLKVHGA